MSHNYFELGQMWTSYLEMEKQLVDYLEYVPLTNDHKKVYSSKLLRLMLQLGGYIDTAFKEISFCPDFDKNNDCLAIRKKTDKNSLITFDTYLSTFEPIFELSRKKVIVKQLQCFSYRPLLIDVIFPFQVEKNKVVPKWWTAYNRVKHNMLKGLKNANIENSLSALSGAFLINSIFKPSLISLLEEGVAKASLSTTAQPVQSAKCDKDFAVKILKQEEKSENVLVVTIESKLFMRITRFTP
jgi:hypothetical protein